MVYLRDFEDQNVYFIVRFYIFCGFEKYSKLNSNTLDREGNICKIKHVGGINMCDV